MYPSDKLLYVLETFRRFVATALIKQPMLKKPLKKLVEAAVPAICDSRLLHCCRSDNKHQEDLQCGSAHGL